MFAQQLYIYSFLSSYYFQCHFEIHLQPLDNGHLQSIGHRNKSSNYGHYDLPYLYIRLMASDQTFYNCNVTIQLILERTPLESATSVAHFP